MPAHDRIASDRYELERRRQDRHRLERIDQVARLRAAVEIWDRARLIDQGDLADRYFVGRRLRGPWPSTLRFGTYDTPRGRFPALIAAAQCWPDDYLAAVQVTPLREPGVKAWRGTSRITHGNMAGAVVRLCAWDPALPIVLVEGVKYGLAVLMAASEAVVWACVDASNAAGISLPVGVEVILALDGDDAGRKATWAATDALRKREHRVRVAELPDGRDPLDVLQETGQ